jgi:hypothetical protein
MRFNHFRRRDFITLLGGAAVWAHVAHAEQAMPVIGYIGTGSRESDAFRLPSFHKAWAKLATSRAKIS